MQFIVPGSVACIMSSILQAVGESSIGFANITDNKMNTRSSSEQAAWQLMGFVFSLASAAVSALVIGLVMKKAHKDRYSSYFDDTRFINIDTKYTVS